GADLLRTDPRPSEAGNTPGRHAIVRADADHHLFDVAHIDVHIAPIGLEVDDRVTDDLSRSVIGHIATAPGLEHIDAQLGEPLGRGHDVGTTAVSANTKSNHRWMLKEEEEVGNPAR